MDLSIYTQPNCVNGVSKEDVDQIKESVAKIAKISNDVQEVQDRVQDLEYFSPDWKLYAYQDWTSLVDENNKLTRDVLISIFSTYAYDADSSPVCSPVKFIMLKGTDLTLIPDQAVIASRAFTGGMAVLYRDWITTFEPTSNPALDSYYVTLKFLSLRFSKSAPGTSWAIYEFGDLPFGDKFTKYLGGTLETNTYYIALYTRPNFNEHNTN